MKNRNWVPYIVIIILVSFGSILFSYETHKGSDTLLQLYDGIGDWIKEASPEQTESNLPYRTHPWLTLRAIQLFEKTYNITLTDFEKQQIMYGSIQEDFDAVNTSTKGAYNHLSLNSPTGIKDNASNINFNRSENHFMNYKDDVEGLTDFGNVKCKSAMAWALNNNTSNLVNWPNAISRINNTNGNDTGWICLGHVLHLLQDMASPAHVRNDAHIITVDNDGKVYFGDKTEKVIGNLSINGHYDLISDPGSVQREDTPEDYFNNLSDYTRNNFFSDNTVFDSAPPSPIGGDGVLPVAQVDNDDKNYFYSKDASGNVHKVAYKGPTYRLLYIQNKLLNPFYSDQEIKDACKIFCSIDDKVAYDTFKLAGKKAIQYCAGLIAEFYFQTHPVNVNYTVSGRVTYNGSGLSGVQISLGSRVTSTDSSGSYSFFNITNGTYSLSASLSGYSFNPSSQAITVSSNNYFVPDIIAMQSNVGSFMKTFGGTNIDEITAMQHTSDGGYILAGYSYSYGNVGWLIKTDASGNKSWEKTFGETTDNEFYSVQQTSDGGYIMAGGIYSNTTNGYDAWLIKTDASGNKSWEKSFHKYYSDIIYSVQQTSDGGYILAGQSAYSVGWLIKTDASGNESWEKTFAGNGTTYNSIQSVRQTSDGGYILAGMFIPYGAGGYVGWLIKTDASGNESWEKTFSENDDNEFFSMQRTSDGGYILAGNTQTLNSDSNVYAWLIKIDASGNKSWGKTLGRFGNELINSVEQTSDGGYILAGYTTSYGPNSYDALLIKTDASGNESWEKTFGGTDEDIINSVLQAGDGGYFLAGYTFSYGAGRADGWLIKTDVNGNAPATPTP